MRILFAFAGGRGHAEPLVPLARAALAAGHSVTFAGRGSVASSLGFDWSGVGEEAAPQPRALVPYSREHEERVLREVFAGRLARAQERDVLALLDRRRPDAVVCDEVDFGSARAASSAGVPWVSVLVVAEGFVPRELRIEGEVVLSPFPRSLRDPGGAFCFRAGDAPPASGSSVYVTLGTVFPLESGDLRSRILSGLAGRDVVAPHGFVPQAGILPRCAAVVSHAGAGTVLGALAHGLPLVCLPIGADQPLWAARVVELGAGVALDPLTATPPEIRAAVDRVVSERSFAVAARRVAAEVAALPTPAEALASATS